MALHLRRALALTVPVLMLSLTACGGDGEETAKGFDAVAVTGEADAAPKVDWKAVMEPGKAETEVLVEGDGPAVKKDDVVLVDFLLANGFTHRTVIDSYGADDAGTSVTVGGTKEPQMAVDLITGLIAEQIEPGMTLGTRIAVTVGVEDALGDYQNQLGDFDIGNRDGLLIVFDLESVALPGPDGKATQPPAWAPSVVEAKGEPTGLDFTGIPKPAPKDPLDVATVIQGTGEKVATGDAVVVDYLGQVHGAAAPFDASYPRDEPITAAIGKDVGGGATPVVEGWSQGLEGVSVGSRVIIRIPPRLGYGAQGNKEAGIKGTDTLYFVVDVLGAV